MKPIKKHYLIPAIVLFCFGCSLVPDLKRDNPADKESPNFVPKKELKFQSYQVVSKYVSGATNPTTENTVKAGDRIFLRINVTNIGQATITKLRTEITSTSNLIQIKPITNYYIKFAQNTTLDYIEVDKSGWSVITDGTSYKFAPNGDYGIEFTVSNLAAIGDKINFHLKSTDDSGDYWEDDFIVTIN